MEPWVSILFSLPVASPRESAAYKKALDFLVGQNPDIEGRSYHTSKGDELPTVHRYRYVEDHPGPGYLNAREALFTMCIAGSIDDAAVRAKIEQIRERLEKIYSEKGAPQDEIICTIQQIYRLKKSTRRR